MATKHSCGGPVFGRKTPGCPRCDELLAGAKPVQWASTRSRCISCGRQMDGYGVCSRCAWAAHDCKASGCSVVCTFGDW